MIIVHKGGKGIGPIAATPMPLELATWLSMKAQRMRATMPVGEKRRLTQADVVIALLLKIKEECPKTWGDKSVMRCIEKGFAK